MNNLEIREFSQAIIGFVNRSPLPLETKRLALKEVMAQLQEAADEAVNTELIQRQVTEKEKENDGEEEKEHGAE